jgi:hypothetical protein
MADTRNTEADVVGALDAATAAGKHRPERSKRLAESLLLYGEKHGFEEAILALGDALLMSASGHMAEAEKVARRQGVADGPAVGDHVAQANRILGIYQQVYAAFSVASATR